MGSLSAIAGEPAGSTAGTGVGGFGCPTPKSAISFKARALPLSRELLRVGSIGPIVGEPRHAATSAGVGGSIFTTTGSAFSFMRGRAPEPPPSCFLCAAAGQLLPVRRPAGAQLYTVRRQRPLPTSWSSSASTRQHRALLGSPRVVSSS